MVDRGGLNYPIRVRDEFSKTTALFRKELRSSKKEFRDFQKVVSGNKSAAKGIRDQAKATKELAAAQRALGAATRKAVKPMTDQEKAAKALAASNKKQLRTLAELARAQKQRERTAIALRAAATRDAKAERTRIANAKKIKQSLDAEFQATKRLNAEKFKQKVVQAQINQLRQQSRDAFNSGRLVQARALNKQAGKLQQSLTGQVNSAQKLLFTFRRLVGALAIFTLARKGVQAFNELVKSGIAFNDTVATAQLGIAGLVVTLGDVRDGMGGSVSATEQLNLALGVARQQSALLRQDSLKTVATFEQLLDTFQVSVGPGLAAGLDLDEVRQLTVDISQAASALGVPQNQLAEEVRSLLSGTIQARTTRIATALGISNEDVRQLKEAGTLFDVLEEKFSGFNEAAQRQARETFSGISTLIKGITQEILGQAAKPLFDELVGLGNQAFDAFLSVQDAAGNIRPNPEVVAAFQQVFDALKRSVQAMQELGGGSAIGALETAMGTIAITIDIVSGVVVGLVESFTFVRDIVADVAEFLGVTSENSGFVASGFATIAVKALLILKAIRLINLSMIRSAALAARWLLPFAAVAKALEFIFSKVSGVNLNLKDTIQIVAVSLFDAFFSVGDAVQALGLGIVNFLESALDKIITAAKNKGSEVKGFLNALFGDSKGAQRAATERLDRELAATNRISARKKAFALEIADIELTAAARKKAVEEEIAKIIGDRAGANAQGEGFDPSFTPGAIPGEGADTGAVPTEGDGGAQVFGRARIDDATLKRVTEETGQLQAQAEAERAKTAAILAGAGPRELALVAAGSAVSMAKAELAALEKKNALELDGLLRQRETLASDGVELENLNEVIAALQVRQGFEEEILRLRTEQLQKAQEEADLVANGSLTDGLKTGFMEFAEQFGSTFQAGVEIARQATAELASFISSEIVKAFDPTVDSTLKERFARFMQSIATIILNQLIQVAIAKGIQELGLATTKAATEAAAATAKGAIEITTATTIAGIQVAAAQTVAAIKAASGGGFNQGGLVPEGYADGGAVAHATKAARAFASGGPTKPSHIPASDTIPAWLTPGEFVMKRSVVQNLGLPLLEAMNGGMMPVVGSQSAEAAGPSTGMASGGLVADQLAASGGDTDSSSVSTVVVPAIVARDGEMDKLTAGGRNAMLAFMRENAGNINSLLDRSNGRG